MLPTSACLINQIGLFDFDSDAFSWNFINYKTFAITKTKRFKQRTYALCFGNPICSRVCRGVRCCFEMRVGVGFFLGGNAAISPTKQNTQQTPKTALVLQEILTRQPLSWFNVYKRCVRLAARDSCCQLSKCACWFLNVAFSVVFVRFWKRVFREMAGVLFEDIFNVKDIDPEGKKFDRGECAVFGTTCRLILRLCWFVRFKADFCGKNLKIRRLIDVFCFMWCLGVKCAGCQQ